MSNPPAHGPDRTGPLLRNCLRAEAELGIALAADPANSCLPPLHRRTTTLDSGWYARTCRVCHDKFREGDQVRLCPGCREAYHDDGQCGLHCWQRRFAGGRRCREGGDPRFSVSKPCGYVWPGHFPGEVPAGGPGPSGARPATPADLLRQFLVGLEAVWQAFGGQQSFQVAHGSPLVGRGCPWCRFRVRAGDRVVTCPCGCGTLFHQDIFRHLECWNMWNGGRGQGHCPNTGRPLPGARP